MPEHEVIQRLYSLRMSVQAIQQRHNDEMAAVMAEIEALLPEAAPPRRSWKKGEFRALMKTRLAHAGRRA